MRKAPVFAAAAVFAVLAVVLVLLFQSLTAPEAPSVAPPPVEVAQAPAKPVVEDAAQPEARVEAAAAPVPAAGPPESYTRNLGKVIGRLVEPDHTPAPGLRIDALSLSFADIFPDLDSMFAESAPSFDEVKATTVSGDDGRFEFEGIEPLQGYVLGIDLGGARATIRFLDQAPNAGQTVDLGDVALDPYVVFFGRVVDEKSNPIAGARIRATNLPSIIFNFGVQDIRPGFCVAFQEDIESNWRVAAIPSWVPRLLSRFPIPTTSSADDGTFRLEGVPMGLVTVLVDKDEKVPLVNPPIASGSGGERGIGDLKLASGYELHGKVVDGADQPVANADVIAGTIVDIAPAALMIPIAKTGADGTFTARGMKDVEHAVAARKAGSVDWTLVRDVVPGDDEPVIKIGATNQVTLIAHDEAGEVLAKPQLTLQRSNQIPLHPLLVPPIALKGRVTYRDDGAAIITELDPGKYSLLARKPGYAVEQVEIDVTQGSTEASVVLVKEFAGAIRVVEKASGIPVEWAMVGAFDDGASRDLKAIPLVNRRTDVDGKVALTGLKRGKYKVVALHPGYAEAHAELVVPGPDLTLELKAGGTLTGRIHQHGQAPQPQRFLAITARGRENFPRFNVTGAEGEFTITHLEEGDYNVVVMRRFANQGVGEIVSQAQSYAPERFVDATISDGQVTTLDIDLLGSDDTGPSAKLRGRVEMNGAPGVGLSLTYRVPGSARGRRTTVSDEQGVYDFGEVPAGKGSIDVAKGSQAGVMNFGRLARFEVELAEGDVKEMPLEIKLGRLRGRVLSARDGTPLATASVRLRSDNAAQQAKGAIDWNADTRIDTVTDKDGAFVFETVPQGAYYLQVQKKEYADMRVGDIAVPYNGEPAPVVVRLVTGVTVTGTVALPEGTEPPRFLALSFRGTDANGSRTGGRVNQDSGKFEVKGLMPGAYEVTVFGPALELEPLQLKVPVDGLEGAVLKFSRKAPEAGTPKVPAELKPIK